MNHLWIRLSLAFSAVVLLAVAVLILAPILLNDRGFQRFLVVGPGRALGGLLDELTAYYEQHQSWAGVEALLADENKAPPGLPILLADANGYVFYSSDSEGVGEVLTDQHRREAVPIIVEGDVQGYLNVIPPPREGSFEGNRDFLWGYVRNALITIALVGGVLGIGFGVLMSRGLTSPLNRLAEAARDIGAHQFSRRVEVKGTAEITAVARAFNEMAAALEESERLRRNLVADVAHELRTPLTVIQGNLRAILDDIYPLNKAEVVQLYEESRLLSRLVDDLHELSQAEAHQLPLNLQPVNLRLLVDDVAASFRAATESQSVTLCAEIASGLPTVQADATRLSQVLHNLLSNALRHTPEGGTISLCAEHDGAHVRLSVRDTGDGIPAEHLPHVFDRFYRVERDRSRETGGAGLGLAIVRAIVEAHGGRVTVASAGVPGLGTTFTIHLPLPA